jgi:oligopeptide transport system permease protein
MQKLKSSFSFVGKERRLYDQPIEGKPISYFQDAMIRFSKNKANVTAAVVLGLLILLSIVVPIATNKNYTLIEEQLTYLPPRVPILEKFGIFDGIETVDSRPVELATIDPITNLGIPTNYDMKYIVPGTLKNFYAPSIDNGSTSLGGEVIFRQSDGYSNYTLQTSSKFLFENDTKVNISIDELENPTNASFRLYIILRNQVFVIGDNLKPGDNEFTISGILGSGRVNSELYIDIQSENSNAGIVVSSISAIKNNEELFKYEAFDLFNEFTLVPETGGSGRKLRINNVTLSASFKYRKYESLFSSRIITIGGVEYNRLLTNNPGMIPSEDPNNQGQFIFPEGYVLKRVLFSSSIINPSTQEVFSTYSVEVDYAKYMGYSSMPYFLFGTDASGKDLFALTWVGLRTSLIIGIIVSFINISFGVIYGAISGYYGGKVDIVMERITEVVGRIPWLVTLSIVTALIGTSVLSLILVLIISGWIGVASVTRAQFYRYKNREYVLASRTMGAKDSRLIFRHILPNGVGTIITSSILLIPGVIFSEAAISYLGFGIGHGSVINFFGLKLSGVSLGVLLSDGQVALMDFPHLTVYPAIIVSILMITFNMFGNGLRDAFNPSLRGAE